MGCAIGIHGLDKQAFKVIKIDGKVRKAHRLKACFELTAGYATFLIEPDFISNATLNFKLSEFDDCADACVCRATKLR